MKKIILLLATISLLALTMAFGVEDSRNYIVSFIIRAVFFVKKHIFVMLASFFLIKGKFILLLFLKKLTILSVVGLGKRYLIEMVIMKNINKYFLSHITEDIPRVVTYAKKNFKSFPLVKKIITMFAFIGSLGFIGKFMGGMLAIKVFIAKVWSFLLAVVIKFSTAIMYFFTDYLWSSWFAPIIEVVIFSWLLSWMEKIPYLSGVLKKIYKFFIDIFGWLEYYLEKIFHIPTRKILYWLLIITKRMINKFIEADKVNAWKRLKQKRVSNPNKQLILSNKRVKRKRVKSLSIYKKILEKR